MCHFDWRGASILVSRLFSAPKFSQCYLSVLPVLIPTYRAGGDVRGMLQRTKEPPASNHSENQNQFYGRFLKDIVACLTATGEAVAILLARVNASSISFSFGTDFKQIPERALSLGTTDALKHCKGALPKSLASFPVMVSPVNKRRAAISYPAILWREWDEPIPGWRPSRTKVTPI